MTGTDIAIVFLAMLLALVVLDPITDLLQRSIDNELRRKR